MVESSTRDHGCSRTRCAYGIAGNSDKCLSDRFALETSTGHGAVLRLRVTGSRSARTEEYGWIWRPNTGSSLPSYEHTGLSPGTQYAYRVSAINEVGAGPTSNVARTRTKAIPPEAPHSLQVEPNGSDQLILSWKTPENDGGAPVTGYKIDGYSGDGSWRIIAHNTRSSGITYTHRRLKPASTWTYRVAAINEAGIGLSSIEASGTTTARAPDPPIDFYAGSDKRVTDQSALARASLQRRFEDHRLYD